MQSSSTLVELFRSKLARLNNTQNSVQTLSQWVQFHVDKRHDLIKVWSEEIFLAAPDRKICFVYLANDIVQGSREFSNGFGSALIKSSADMKKRCSKTIIDKVHRMVGIWKQRSVFKPSVLEQIENQLKGQKYVQEHTTHESLLSSIPANPLLATLEEIDREAVQDAVSAVAAAPFVLDGVPPDQDWSPLRNHLTRLEKRKNRTTVVLALLKDRIDQEEKQLEECEKELQVYRDALAGIQKKRTSSESEIGTEDTSLVKKPRSTN